MIPALAFAALVLLVGSWFGWQLLRQNGRMLLRLDELEDRLNELEFRGDEAPEGLPLGTEAPAIELPCLKGERKSLEQFRGRPVLLIFFNPDCVFCREMIPKLAPIIRQPVSLPGSSEASPLMVILTNGDAERNRQVFAPHNLGCTILVQNGDGITNAYQAHGTPSGYLITADGKIASELAIGAEALLQLASQPAQKPPTGDGIVNRFSNRSLARSKLKRDGLEAGAFAPDFRLPRLDGRDDLTLSQLRGNRVFLVFSSPHCGPCNSLAPELEKFHRQHPELEVVLISKGDPKENRAKVKEHNLTFPIALQQQWEISRRYAMFATPIAYLIDEAGVISHDVAVGAEQILALMGEARAQ